MSPGIYPYEERQARGKFVQWHPNPQVPRHGIVKIASYSKALRLLRGGTMKVVLPRFLFQGFALYYTHT